MTLRKESLFIILLLLLISCQKDTNKDDTVYLDVDEQLKNQYHFLKGSYWVYENQDFERDSISIKNQQSGFTHACPFDCPRKEFINTTFYSSASLDTFNYYLIESDIKYRGGGSHGHLGQRIFNTSLAPGEALNALQLVENLDSLSIGATTFYAVQHFKVIAKDQLDNHEAPIFNYDRDFFFVPDVGLVRQIIQDSLNGPVVWDLKDYFILK